MAHRERTTPSHPAPARWTDTAGASVSERGSEPSGGSPGVDLLAHDDGDHVAVAVRDLSPGDVHVAWLASDRRQSMTASDAIPFGHKISLAAARVNL